MNHDSIFDEVQAILLNSECKPELAIFRALQAVASFADGDLDATADDIRNLKTVMK